MSIFEHAFNLMQNQKHFIEIELKKVEKENE